MKVREADQFFSVYTVVSEDLRASSRAILTDADRLKKAHCRATV